MLDYHDRALVYFVSSLNTPPIIGTSNDLHAKRTVSQPKVVEPLNITIINIFPF